MLRGARPGDDDWGFCSSSCLHFRDYKSLKLNSVDLHILDPSKCKRCQKWGEMQWFLKLHCKSRHAPGTADGEICMAGKMMAGSIAVFEYNLVNLANVMHDATMLQGRRFWQTSVEGKHCTVLQCYQTLSKR